MTINLSGHVAIVTGGGAGLGRAHALALADRGACVVVNDRNSTAAEDVCKCIVASGGEAMPNDADVTAFDQVVAMVGDAVNRWAKVDILVNNAGILRDRSFAKMELDMFRLVIEVHLMGSVNCAKAVWNGMRERKYGRIIFTTSSSGLYGNYGQSNYGAAKMALVGLMQTLALEGERDNVRVNCLAPSAATDMTNGLYPAVALAGLSAELVSPAVIVLSSPDAPTRRIVLAGGGCFEQANITMTRGINLGSGANVPDLLLQRLADLDDRNGEFIPPNGSAQYQYEVAQIAASRPATMAETK